MGAVRCGIDLVKVPRIKEAIERHGATFLKRIFSEGEIDYCESHARRKFEHYAGRFAAKEAFYKAVSPAEAKIRFRDLEVKHLSNGAPELHVHDGEKKRLGLSESASISVSLAHDTDYAVAVVLIS